MCEKDFCEEVEDTIQIYEEIIGYFAARTRQMIKKHGKITALSLLMKSSDLQQGFKKLRDVNQLDKTFEFIVIKYKALFDSDVVKAAQWRLDHPYHLL